MYDSPSSPSHSTEAIDVQLDIPRVLILPSFVYIYSLTPKSNPCLQIRIFSGGNSTFYLRKLHSLHPLHIG